MTTAAARCVGGATKLVPWATSIGPVHDSIRGQSTRRHSARSGRAAIGRVYALTPSGRAAAKVPRPRHVSA